MKIECLNKNYCSDRITASFGLDLILLCLYSSIQTVWSKNISKAIAQTVSKCLVHHRYTQQQQWAKPSVPICVPLISLLNLGPYYFSSIDIVGSAKQSTGEKGEKITKTRPWNVSHYKCIQSLPPAHLEVITPVMSPSLEMTGAAPHENVTEEHDTISLGWATPHTHASLLRPQQVVGERSQALGLCYATLQHLSACLGRFAGDNR